MTGIRCGLVGVSVCGLIGESVSIRLGFGVQMLHPSLVSLSLFLLSVEPDVEILTPSLVPCLFACHHVSHHGDNGLNL